MLKNTWLFKHSLDAFKWQTCLKKAQLYVPKCMGIVAREGVIIEWPLNGQFHEAPDVIITSRTEVSEMNADDDNDVEKIVNVLNHY